MANPTKTNVIGYFNGNDYSMRIDLSEQNLVLNIPPKGYVIDRTGRLVNDPILDRYVGRGKLSRASDPKQQTDVILLRPVNDTSAGPVLHSHSVTQVNGFETKDGRVTAQKPTGDVKPVNTPPPQSYNPVKGMTIEQAKALKLIKPTRPVPEDFGAEETTGAPKAGQDIPNIAYAVDTVRGRKPTPLPAELASPATPQQAAIIQSLQRASNLDPESPGLLSQVARSVVSEARIPAPAPAPAPKTEVPTVSAMPSFPKPILGDQGPAKFVRPPPLSERVPTIIETSAPEPEPEPDLLIEEEICGMQPDATDAEHNLEAEDRVEAALRVPPPPSPGSTELNCPICGKLVSSVSRLKSHASYKHPNEYAQLCKDYTE